MAVLPEQFASAVAPLLASGRYGCSPSWTPPSAEPPASLFFYHIPKTGGLSFWLAMLHAFVQGWPAAWPQRKIGRLDAPLPAYVDDASPDRIIPGSFIFAASHHGYGLHRLLGPGVRLTTMLRDPYSRVVSDYSYTCMRGNRAPSPHDFQSFFRAPENRNRMTRQIGATWPAASTHPDPDPAGAISRLENEFESFVTLGDLPDLLSRYLNIFGLPSVLMERLNRTAPEFRFDASAWRDEIIERNAADVVLYDHVALHRRLPPAPPAAGPLNARTLLVREAATQPRMAEQATLHDTVALHASLLHQRAAGTIPS